MIETYKDRMATNGPSIFQLSCFVIGKEPTHQAKMHKCLNEIQVREESISKVKLEIEEVKDQSRLIEIDNQRIPSKYDGEEAEIYCRKNKRKLEANKNHIDMLQKKINCWRDEIDFLTSVFKELENKSPLQNWNDWMVQLEYWSEKMHQEIDLRLLMNAPIDMEIIKTIFSLPDNSPIRKKMIEYVDKKKNKGALNG